MRPAAGGWCPPLAARLADRARAAPGRPGGAAALNPALAVGFLRWGVTVSPQASRVSGSGDRRGHRRGATMSLAGWLRTRRGAMRRAQGRGAADSHKCHSGKLLFQLFQSLRRFPRLCKGLATRCCSRSADAAAHAALCAHGERAPRYRVCRCGEERVRGTFGAVEGGFGRVASRRGVWCRGPSAGVGTRKCGGAEVGRWAVAFWGLTWGGSTVGRLKGASEQRRVGLLRWRSVAR